MDFEEFSNMLHPVIGMGSTTSAFVKTLFDAIITDPPYASGGRTQAEKNKSTAQKYSSCLIFIARPPCHTFVVWYADKLSTFHYSISLL